MMFHSKKTLLFKSLTEKKSLQYLDNLEQQKEVLKRTEKKLSDETSNLGPPSVSSSDENLTSCS